MSVANILTAIVLALAILGTIFGSGAGSHDSVKLPETPIIPIPTTSAVLRDSDGKVSVNLLQLGATLDDVRLTTADFPSDGTEVFVESGAKRTMFEYQDAKYFFNEGVLDQVRIKQTPEFIHPGNTLMQAKEFYGETVKAFEASNGNHYAVMEDSIDPDAVWVFGYNPTTKQISTISLAEESSYTISNDHRPSQ